MKIAQTMGNESLKAAIKNAQKDVNKKKKAVEVAEKNLTVAENHLYSLKCQFDSEYLHSLQGKPDWKLIFTHNIDETGIIYDYREQVLKEYGLERTGQYNIATNQHVFCIDFESNSKNELLHKTTQIAFVLKNLKFDPDGKKRIAIHNVKDDDDNYWELIFLKSLKKYKVVCFSNSEVIESYNFSSLGAALEKVQNISDIAFEVNDIKLISAS